MDPSGRGEHSSGRGLGRRDLLRGIAIGSAALWAANLLGACQQPTTPPASTLAPSGKTAAEVPKRGGSLRMAQSNEVAGMDPYAQTSVSDKIVYHAIYDGLVALDRDLRVVPQLATSWSTPDERTYVFTLRDSVTFHDGTACDAAAVKQSFDWLLDPANAAQARPELS